MENGAEMVGAGKAAVAMEEAVTEATSRPTP
jgi:glycerate-2-kinase